MARRFAKKHLFWLVPTLLLVLLVVAVASGLMLARAQGWRWQGLAWQDGLTLKQLTWRDGDCTRLLAQNMRLQDMWPLQLSVARVEIRNCGTEADSGGGFAIPPAPPFDVVVQALQMYDYPAVHITAHHHGARWWAKASMAGGHLRASYTADSQRWQLAGQVAMAHVREGYAGTLTIQGEGYWRPGADTANRRFGGQLRIDGQQLGRQQQRPRADMTTTVAWQGKDWTLNAALAQPLALGNAWIVQSGRGVHATGSGLTLNQANVALTMQGPQLRAELSLQSDADRFGSGHGRVVLSHGVNGHIRLNWADGTIRVKPFTVIGTQGVKLSLDKALTIQVAQQGRIAPMLSVAYGAARASTKQSRLEWNGPDVSWSGAVKFAGSWHGYALGGGWSGALDRTGLHGEPLRLTLDGAGLSLQAQLPVAKLWPTDWPVSMQLDGEYRDQAFVATVTAAPANGGWAGHIQAHGRLRQLDQGGKLNLTANWRWQDGLVLAVGARLSMTRALRGGVLIEPVELTATTPVTIHAQGMHGRLRLQAGGLTAARWQLPSLQADIKLEGWQLAADVRVPEWNGALTLHAHNLRTAAAGTFSARLPLQPAISRGLGVVARAGVLNASGDWHAGNSLAISGRLQASDVRLDWGSILATGLQADVAVDWQPGSVRIRSRGPVTVAKLASGVALTDIRFDVDSDLHSWHFYEASALLLGGKLTAPVLTWPSTDDQPVFLSGIDVAQIVALQSQPVVKATGRVGGTIPLRLSRSSLAIRNGHLHNETLLTLSIPESDGVRALKQTGQAVSLALDVLSSLRIHGFTTTINMDADGLLKAAMTIKGINPRLGQPIVLNYTHQENMFELLRNLRISGRVVDAVIGDHAVVEAPPEEP